METMIEVPRDVLESLIALAGTGQYGTPAQRMHLADAKDILHRDAVRVASEPPATGWEQPTLF